MNQSISLVKLSHQQVKDKLKPGDCVIDATAGNGHDTLFLAEMTGSQGKVFAFDIQQRAIENTRFLLQKCGLLERVTLIPDDHANLRQHIPDSYLGKISAVMFNLGYLPGSDKRVITQPKATLSALNCVLDYLASGGIITILAYPGHAGGDVETGQVASWCEKLNQEKFRFYDYKASSLNPFAPRLFVVEKIDQ